MTYWCRYEPCLCTWGASPGALRNHLRRFIECTNHKRGLHAIRRINFAYHASETERSEEQPTEQLPLPELAELVLNLDLLPAQPFCRLTCDRALTKEANAAKKLRVMVEFDWKIRIALEPENGPKKLCKALLEDIARDFHRTCRDQEIGRP